MQLTSNNKPKFCTEIEINLYQPENYTSFYCVEIIQGVISTDLRTDFSKSLTYSLCRVHKALCTKL